MRSAGTLRLGAALLAVLISAASAPGCKREKPAAPDAKKGRPPVPVLTAVAAQADVPVEIRALGSVEPVQSSPIRSQVSGIVTEVAFRDGGLVKAGQVLFRIDRRPIEATVRQLEANLARDEAQMRNAEAQTRSAEAQMRNAEAQLKNAEAQARRYEGLVRGELVSREQYDQRVTNQDAALAALDASRAAAQASRAGLEAARASAEATKAAIENARLQLEYTVITSPVSGQAGNLLVDKGDLVKVNDTTLVVVNQLQPILVRFTVPEPRLPEVQRYRAAGTLKVRALPAGPGAAPREGRLVFLDNTVDKATGTIALKAEFDNADAALWPGQFVDVALVLTVREKAVTVPSQAVQTGQQDSYVFVVESNGTAAVRPVKTAGASNGITVIESGLAAAEIVVTDGQLRLTPGAPVVQKSDLAGPRPGTPAAARPGQPGNAPGTAATPAPERPR